jgi:hypothetical protein
MKTECSLPRLQQLADPFLSQNYQVHASIPLPEDPS